MQGRKRDQVVVARLGANGEVKCNAHEKCVKNGRTQCDVLFFIEASPSL